MEELDPEDRIAVFQSKDEEGPPLFKFIYAVTRKTESHFGIVVAALALIDRLQTLHPQLTINSRNGHRLYLTALLISSKYLEDLYYSNKYFAKISGLCNIDEMNELELTMLELLDFQLKIPEAKYNWYVKNLAPKSLNHVDVSTWLYK